MLDNVILFYFFQAVITLVEKCFLHNLSWRIKINQGLFIQTLICFCRSKMDNRIRIQIFLISSCPILAI